MNRTDTTQNMNIIILGVGLISGSLALALRQNHPAKPTISAYFRNQDKLNAALKLNLCDKGFTSVEKCLSALREEPEQKNIIILGTILSDYENKLNTIKDYLQNNAQYINTQNIIISDIGSTKFEPINSILHKLPELKEHFIPAHPIAGKEVAGLENADASLFQNKKLLITPLDISTPRKINNYTDKVAIIKNLWETCGAACHFISAEEHDKIYGKISHFVQHLSFALKGIFGEEFSRQEENGFLRLTKSSPNIWQDIFLYNAPNIKESCKEFAVAIQNIIKDLSNSPLNNDKNTHQQSQLDEDILLAKIIASSVYNITTEKDRSFAGSGFSSITNINKGRLDYKPSVTANSMDSINNRTKKLLKKIYSNL